MSTDYQTNEPTDRMELCVLASGSAGNCAVLRTPGGAVLIDAGIGPRTVAARLKGTGIAMADISGICLTHLDRDHFSPSWVATIVEHGIRVFCFAGRAERIVRIVQASAAGSLSQPFAALVQTFAEAFDPLPDVSAHAVPLSHDVDGSHGFVFAGLCGRSVRIGYATDLGNVTDRLIEAFDAVDVLALESNYDPRMLRESGRPLFLKRRISGGRGHLSNEQAFQAVRTLFDRCQRRRQALPAHVVLLHRSQQCNCPNLVRTLFSRDPRIASRLTLAEQFDRSDWLGPAERLPAPGEQLLLRLG